MSTNYAEIKIREALKLTGDNEAQARRQILTLAQDDPKLLQSLCGPHLEGIVAYQVERVASGRAELEKRHPEDVKISEGENFGMDLLRAIAAQDVTVFGQENTAGAKTRKSASKQHIDAIHQMAKKTRDKK